MGDWPLYASSMSSGVLFAVGVVVQDRVHTKDKQEHAKKATEEGEVKLLPSTNTPNHHAQRLKAAT
jgi:hypothetical protein